MALQLVLGRAGTGKTTALLKEIEKRAQAGQASLLLVPEQFSSSAEGMMYRLLGDAQSAHVQVASFRTLAQRMLRAAGRENQPVLGDAARAVFVRRALDALGENAHAYVRHRRSAAFCAMCADTLNELKTAGATPAVLRRVGQDHNEPKFAELAVLFEAYEAALQNQAMDPQDVLTRASEYPPEGFFEGIDCYIDNFDGFTAPEYKLLACLLGACNSVTVALCCNDLQETEGGMGLFSPVRKTAQRLIRLAQREGVNAKAPRVLAQQQRCENDTLARVARALEGETLEPAQGGPALTLTDYADEWDELVTVAAQIYALAVQGVPYNRIAVVCREIALYESSVRRAFGLFDIPCFVDSPGTAEYTAPVSFLRAALRLLREGLTSGPILALLKTGLWGCDTESLSALENYVFTWNPRAAEWRVPFEKNPEGLMANDSEGAGQALALAEGLRCRVVPVLEDFLKRARGASAAQISRQLYLLMQKVGAARQGEALARQLEVRGELVQADRTRRAWDVAMGLLEQMTHLLGEERLTAAEYEEIFLLAARCTEFGQAPQALEGVMFTSADRMRLADPDYCFVVGLCEGEFPREVGHSGLLTHADRDLLVHSGVDMPGGFENRVQLEEMFLYRAFTAPRKNLHLSWPARRGGEAKDKTSALVRIQEALCPQRLCLQPWQLAATPKAAFEMLATVYRENSSAGAALYQALSRQGEMETALPLLHKVHNAAEIQVEDKALLERVVGSTLTLSATKVERYYECSFSYFMERVLGIRPRRKAEFSPLESGQFVHYVLEHALRQVGAQLAQQSDEALGGLANEIADAFIAQYLPEAGLRVQHILGRIKNGTTELLCHLRNGAQQSAFSVDALELGIGYGPQDIPPLEIKLPQGQSVRVTGKIDRVDVLRRGERTYLSVMDYKTGSKSFNLDKVYCGLNMQMLIYMDTLLKNGAQRYKNPSPAAVLYLASDPAPATAQTREGQEGSVYKVDGLVLRDEELVKAFDDKCTGVFVPCTFNKNGSLKNGKALASLEKLGAIQQHVEGLLEQMAKEIYGGRFAARPLVKSNDRPCRFCAYRPVCRHEDGLCEVPITAPANVFEEGENDGD